MCEAGLSYHWDPLEAVAEVEKLQVAYMCFITLCLLLDLFTMACSHPEE